MGGFIATVTSGSNEDPSVKFLLGFSHVALEQLDFRPEDSYNFTYLQIKVIRGNKLLDKYFYKIHNMEYIDASFLGRKGLKGVDDIIKLVEPCLGGCGCSGGDEYFAWDAKS